MDSFCYDLIRVIASFVPVYVITPLFSSETTKCVSDFINFCEGVEGSDEEQLTEVMYDYLDEFIDTLTDSEVMDYLRTYGLEKIKTEYDEFYGSHGSDKELFFFLVLQYVSVEEVDTYLSRLFL